MFWKCYLLVLIFFWKRYLLVLIFFPSVLISAVFLIFLFLLLTAYGNSFVFFLLLTKVTLLLESITSRTSKYQFSFLYFQKCYLQKVTFFWKRLINHNDSLITYKNSFRLLFFYFSLRKK